MPRFKQVNKRQQKYLKIIYLLTENGEENRKEKGSFESLSDKYQIETLDNPYHIPENAQLWGVLPSKVITNYSLANEFILDKDRAAELKNEISNYAWERLLKYLSFRERSIDECRNYLKNLPVSNDLIKSLIQRALEKKFLNEERFAELLTQSYISRRKSKTELKTSLISKRIPPEMIEKVLQENYNEEDKKEILQYHIEKGIRKYPDKNSAKDYQKCIAYLMRKGFHYGDFRDDLLKYYHNIEDD
ncbi:MAG: RecX family transcriptional regulator [Candidatus Cloacimonetes bacterium]|nr:RecX family transcriptional regulator [Candidatus Cloacimonadota bacterium]